MIVPSRSLRKKKRNWSKAACMAVELMSICGMEMYLSQDAEWIDDPMY